MFVSKRALVSKQKAKARVGSQVPTSDEVVQFRLQPITVPSSAASEDDRFPSLSPSFDNSKIEESGSYHTRSMTARAAADSDEVSEQRWQTCCRRWWKCHRETRSSCKDQDTVRLFHSWPHTMLYFLTSMLCLKLRFQLSSFYHKCVFFSFPTQEVKEDLNDEHAVTHATFKSPVKRRAGVVCFRFLQLFCIDSTIITYTVFRLVFPTWPEDALIVVCPSFYFILFAAFFVTEPFVFFLLVSSLSYSATQEAVRKDIVKGELEGIFSSTLPDGRNLKFVLEKVPVRIKSETSGIIEHKKPASGPVKVCSCFVTKKEKQNWRFGSLSVPHSFLSLFLFVSFKKRITKAWTQIYLDFGFMISTPFLAFIFVLHTAAHQWWRNVLRVREDNKAKYHIHPSQDLREMRGRFLYPIEVTWKLEKDPFYFHTFPTYNTPLYHVNFFFL